MEQIKKIYLKYETESQQKEAEQRKKNTLRCLRIYSQRQKKEVEYQKALSKNTSVLDALMDTLVKTEQDYTKFSLQTDNSNTAKQEYYKVQTKLLHELFKKNDAMLAAYQF